MTRRGDSGPTDAAPRRRGGRAGRLERLGPAAAGGADVAPAGASTAFDPLAPAGEPAPGADGNAGRTLVVACGALVRELVDVIRLNGWRHLSVAALPAKLHNRPEKIPEAVRRRIRGARERQGFGRVLVLYGDCGTGGLLDRVLEEEGVERIAGEHCYAFYAGLDRFAALHAAEPGTFYLTDYLVRQFDALVVRGLGLDRHPELIPAYFGNYKRLVYLAQLPSPELESAARAAAQRLGLPVTIETTGAGSLERFLGRND